MHLRFLVSARRSIRERSGLFGMALFALGWCSPLGHAQQAPAKPAPEAPQQALPKGPLLKGTVTLAGLDPYEFHFGFDGNKNLRAFNFPTEDREGVAVVIGGHAAIPGPKGRSGPTFLFFLHAYSDGTHYLEAQLLNDAIVDPPGKLDAVWHIEFAGKVVADGKGTLLDQCGVAFQSGTPQFAPRQDLWQHMQQIFPPQAKVTGFSIADAEPKADPDPVASTHQTGSPRNRYVAVEAAKYYYSQDERYLARLLDFVAAQARRPYHLSESDGTPFQQPRHPEAWFIEGRPEMKPYRDTFGRLQLTAPELEKPKYNGWDPEHMNVEELYAAYVLTGSRIARRELLLIAEQLLSTPMCRTEGYSQHSARAFGWVMRALVRAHQVSGEDRYVLAIQRMMESVRKVAVMKGNYKALIPLEPRNDHMKNERYESPFMVAVAASALALYVDIEPNDEGGRELMKLTGDLLVERGYSPTQGGFVYDYSCDSGNTNGDPAQIDGVVLWIPSALAEVAMRVPENERAKYLDVARAVFAKQSANKWGTPAQDYFFCWFLKAARETQ